jgi:hypothetical protein
MHGKTRPIKVAGFFKRFCIAVWLLRGDLRPPDYVAFQRANYSNRATVVTLIAMVAIAGLATSALLFGIWLGVVATTRC